MNIYMTMLHARCLLALLEHKNKSLKNNVLDKATEEIKEILSDLRALSQYHNAFSEEEIKSFVEDSMKVMEKTMDLNMDPSIKDPDLVEQYNETVKYIKESIIHCVNNANERLKNMDDKLERYDAVMKDVAKHGGIVKRAMAQVNDLQLAGRGYCFGFVSQWAFNELKGKDKMVLNSFSDYETMLLQKAQSGLIKNEKLSDVYYSNEMKKQLLKNNDRTYLKITSLENFDVNQAIDDAIFYAKSSPKVVVGLNLYGNDAAHIVGLRFNEKNNAITFMDANGGEFVFKNEDQFKRWSQEYFKTMEYDKKYNRCYLSVFSNSAQEAARVSTISGKNIRQTFSKFAQFMRGAEASGAGFPTSRSQPFKKGELYQHFYKHLAINKAPETKGFNKGKNPSKNSSYKPIFHEDNTKIDIKPLKDKAGKETGKHAYVLTTKPKSR